MNKEFNYDSGVAFCKLYDKVSKQTHYGYATCHPDDSDVASEITGCTIASLRADIKLYQSVRDNEIIPALKALKQLHYSINKSKYYNKKSYESRMLWRQIRMYEDQLTQVRELIKDTRATLHQYIKDKETAAAEYRAKQDK